MERAIYLFSHHVPPIVGFLICIFSKHFRGVRYVYWKKRRRNIRGSSILLVTNQLIVLEISLRLVRGQKTRDASADVDDFDMALFRVELFAHFVVGGHTGKHICCSSMGFYFFLFGMNAMMGILLC